MVANSLEVYYLNAKSTNRNIQWLFFIIHYKISVEIFKIEK